MASKLPNLKFKNVLLNNTSSSEDDLNRSSEDEKGIGYDLGLTLEKLNLGPRKKLLVLSLGGLLVHRIHARERISVPGNVRPDIVNANFRDLRWESGPRRWSEYLEINLFEDQEKCTNSGFGSLEKKGKPIFLKELKKVWEKKSIRGKYSSANTLLIDDEPYKALLNPPNTAIFPPKFKVENIEDEFLGPKGELQMYLDGLADSSSVPCYVKEHPFGQPAITPSHSDWHYYSKIIRNFH
ncbi:hypothetical protein LguiB_035053 [Lonicera macranthoides]